MIVWRCKVGQKEYSGVGVPSNPSLKKEEEKKVVERLNYISQKHFKTGIEWEVK